MGNVSSSLFFSSFIEFAHHIFPSLVVTCNLLLDQIGSREPKYCCLQHTKGDPVRSRCFQVAYLLKMASFGCAPTGDNRRWQCKVHNILNDSKLELCWTLSSWLLLLTLCWKDLLMGFELDPWQQKQYFYYHRITRLHVCEATQKWELPLRCRFLCLVIIRRQLTMMGSDRCFSYRLTERGTKTRGIGWTDVKSCWRPKPIQRTFPPY